MSRKKKDKEKKMNVIRNDEIDRKIKEIEMRETKSF